MGTFSLFISSQRHLLLSPGSLQTEVALVFDAVQLFAKALDDLERSRHINVTPLDCDGDVTWIHGNSFINYMKWVSTNCISCICIRNMLCVGGIGWYASSYFCFFSVAFNIPLLMRVIDSQRFISCAFSYYMYYVYLYHYCFVLCCLRDFLYYKFFKSPTMLPFNLAYDFTLLHLSFVFWPVSGTELQYILVL